MLEMRVSCKEKGHNALKCPYTKVCSRKEGQISVRVLHLQEFASRFPHIVALQKQIIT